MLLCNVRLKGAREKQIKAHGLRSFGPFPCHLQAFVDAKTCAGLGLIFCVTREHAEGGEAKMMNRVPFDGPFKCGPDCQAPG